MENMTEMEIKTPPKIHAYAYHICRHDIMAQIPWIALYNDPVFIKLAYSWLLHIYFKGPFSQLHQGREQEFFPQQFKVIDISIETINQKSTKLGKTGTLCEPNRPIYSREDINFMFEWQDLYLTQSLRSLVRYILLGKRVSTRKLIYVKKLAFFSLKVSFETLIDVRNDKSRHHFLKAFKIHPEPCFPVRMF